MSRSRAPLGTSSAVAGDRFAYLPPEQIEEALAGKEAEAGLPTVTGVSPDAALLSARR